MYLRLHNAQSLSKARLLGIAHESYVTCCADYNLNNITKYNHTLLEYNGEYALDVGNCEGLPEVFLPSLEETLPEGWIPQEPQGE